MACIPSGAAAAKNSHYFYGQKDAEYLLDADYVFGQNIT